MVEFQTEREKWAWVAALIDGEGTLTLSRAGSPGLLHPCIRITNTNLELLEEIKRHTGMKGIFYYRRRDHGRFGHKAQAFVEARGLRLVLSILKNTLPFLIVKRWRAEVAVEYLESIVDWRGFIRDNGIEAYRRLNEEFLEKFRRIAP